MVSTFGPQKERVKMDLRLPRELHEQVGDVCELLGTPKNAFFALAAGLLVMELSALQTEKKRDKARKVTSLIVQKVLKRIRT